MEKLWEIVRHFSFDEKYQDYFVMKLNILKLYAILMSNKCLAESQANQVGKALFDISVKSLTDQNMREHFTPEVTEMLKQGLNKHIEEREANKQKC